MPGIVGREAKARNTACSPLAATASSTADVLPVAGAGLAVDDALRPGPDHVGHRTLAQRVVLGPYDAGIKVEEVPAHQSVASPSSDTARAGPPPGAPEPSALVTTVVGSASAVAVAGEGP